MNEIHDGVNQGSFHVCNMHAWKAKASAKNLDFQLYSRAL